MPAVRVLLLPLLLGLNACSAKSLTQVRGEVRGWTLGMGSVEFLSDDLKTLSSADLDAVGRFNLGLPLAQTITPLLQDSLIPKLPAGCASTVRASSAAKYYSLGDITAYPGSGQKTAYTLVSEDRAGSNSLRITRRLFIYASQAVDVSGTLSCPVTGQQPVAIAAVATYGLDLKAGWNRVESNQTVYNSGASQTALSTTGEDGFDRWTVAP
ncbi:hypothetical protein [Deinococcus sp.]|uniref:hypothetical protein n=1 Tax=Deinococcus sp. TaxID=47478 RepID=UPI003C7A6033